MIARGAQNLQVVHVERQRREDAARLSLNKETIMSTDTSNSNNRHPHADIIIAWANGETIGVLDESNWMTVDPNVAPTFAPRDKYRIKPKVVMIRHYTLKNGNTTMSIAVRNYSDVEDIYVSQMEASDDVIWLDDWHEASFGPASST